MVPRRQLGIALISVVAALVVLVAVGTAPAVDGGRDRPRVPFAVAIGRTEQGLPVTRYASWANANDRFAAAARAFGTTLGGCRMRLGSFHACARAAAATLAYEGHNAAGVAAAFDRQPGPCGSALRGYRLLLGDYMASAQAFADLPHGHPMSAIGRMQRALAREHESYATAALRVRGACRPG
ncbi:MAG TPA: hypothetical protein VGC71_16610 [Gaiellales bacterium]